MLILYCTVQLGYSECKQTETYFAIGKSVLYHKTFSLLNQVGKCVFMKSSRETDLKKSQTYICIPFK